MKKFKMIKRKYQRQPKSPVEQDINKAIGAKVRDLRIMRGLSMEELGKEIGVTYQQLQKYEKGVNRISVGKLVLISRVLRIELLEIFEDLHIEESQRERSTKTEKFQAAPRDVLKTASFLANIKDPAVRRSFRALSKALTETNSK